MDEFDKNNKTGDEDGDQRDKWKIQPLHIYSGLHLYEVEFKSVWQEIVIGS